MEGGSSEMVYDEENDQFVIKARALCFPMLVHEIVKGLYEIVAKIAGPEDINVEIEPDEEDPLQPSFGQDNEEKLKANVVL